MKSFCVHMSEFLPSTKGIGLPHINDVRQSLIVASISMDTPKECIYNARFEVLLAVLLTIQVLKDTKDRNIFTFRVKQSNIKAVRSF
jgi:hypothetical protein